MAVFIYESLNVRLTPFYYVKLVRVRGSDQKSCNNRSSFAF